MKIEKQVVVSVFVATLVMLLTSVAPTTAANLVVNNCNETGSGSLYEAITLANANAESDLITFACSHVNLNTTILPPLRESGTTIDGGNATVITGPGSWKNRALTIEGGTGIRDIEIMNLKISGFQEGITADGILTEVEISNVTISEVQFGIQFYGTLNNINIYNNIVTADLNYESAATITVSPREGWSDGISINGNTAKDGQFGLILRETSKVSKISIEHNSVTGGNGISVSTGQGSGSTVTNVVVSENTVKDTVESHPGIIVIANWSGQTSNNCTIDDILISVNDLTNTNGIAAIITNGVNNSITRLLVRQNRLTAPQRHGIKMSNESDSTNRIEGEIRNNIMLENSPAIDIYGNQVWAAVVNNFCGGNDEGIDIKENAKVWLENNLIIQNGYGIYADATTTVEMTNNLIVGNCGCGVDAEPGASIVLAYNDVWDNGKDYRGITAGPNDMSQDPLFLNAAAGDYHLKSNSPCIDAGNPEPEYNDAIPPGQGAARNDIGAYGGPGAAEFVFSIPEIQASCRWNTAYGQIFSNSSDLELLRRYRDQTLRESIRGRLYTALLYHYSDDALNILLTNRGLIKQMRRLMADHREGLSRVLAGQTGYADTEQIISFFDVATQEAPFGLKLLGKAVRWEMLDSKRMGRSFFGFNLR